VIANLVSRLDIILISWLSRYLFSLSDDTVNKLCGLGRPVLLGYNVDILNYTVEQLINNAVDHCFHHLST
jgi:hypothetical protein